MKKNKGKCIFICIAAIIMIGGGSCLYYYATHHITADLEKQAQTEITGTLNRPECGWYQIYAYYLQPDTALTADELYLNETDEDGKSYRLALVEFNIKEYASRSLDRSAKENIETVFQAFSQTRAKIIVRFLYDWEGQGTENEPSNMEWVKKHMTQAGKLLNQYKNIIYTTQGIFVGSWAEMHHSNYLSAEEMTTLILHYASVTDTSIYLAVRTPEQYRTIFEEYRSHPEKYSDYKISASDLEKRLGFFNDGILGSVSDVGTYHKADIASSESEKLAIRQKELSFQEKIALHTPNGGEVVNDNAFNDGTAAITDLSTMHVSYLNQMYDTEVLKKWKNTACTDDMGIYADSSVYDYITDHLGARFVLKDSTLSYQSFQPGNATGSITIENTGFASLYHTKKFTLSLQGTNNTELTLLSSEEDTQTDPCEWEPGECVVLEFSFSPFALEDGTYYLIARLTDNDTGEILSFANDSYLDEYNGYCLGKITIRR